MLGCCKTSDESKCGDGVHLGEPVREQRLHGT